MSPDPSAPVAVHVGIGSNLGDRVANVEHAVAALRALSESGEVECSALYESAPMGPSDQPDYVNAVCAFQTASGPRELLVELQRIEREAGRVRPAPRWSARTLDLDLLLYGARTVREPDLSVPHPGIAERAFVLRPLADLDPALEVPGLGPVRALLETLERGEGDEPGGLRPLAGARR